MTTLPLDAGPSGVHASGPRVWSLLAGQLGYALRDLWRTRIVFIFTFLFPLTWLVVIGFLVDNTTVDEDTGVRVMQFVTPTAAVMGLLYGAYPTVASSLADAREHGVLKRVRSTPLPAWIYLAGRIGAAVVFAVGSLITMLVVGVIAYDLQIVWRTAFASLVTVVCATASFAAAGLAVASLIRSASLAQAVSIGTAVVLAFLSGVMTEGAGAMPAWADRVAAVFPLKPFNDALQDQFNPFRTGSGWDLGALAVMAAWAVGSGLVAARAFRWDRPAVRQTTTHMPIPGSASARLRSSGTTGAQTAMLATVERPSRLGLLGQQAAWATRAAIRDVGWVFFAVALPVALYAFTAAVLPSGPLTSPPYGLQVAASMMAWGALITGFINMPEAVARARDQGVLKRLRGTPLETGLYFAGRLASALGIALATATLVLLAGLLWFDLDIAWSGLPLAAAVLILGMTTLLACGMLMVSLLPSSKAVTAVGLGVAIPLAFFSDIFAIGLTPSWMGTVGSFLPLKHLANSISLALDPAGPRISWLAIAVMSGWLIGAGLLAVRFFRWEARS